MGGDIPRPTRNASSCFDVIFQNQNRIIHREANNLCLKDQLTGFMHGRIKPCIGISATSFADCRSLSNHIDLFCLIQRKVNHQSKKHASVATQKTEIILKRARDYRAAEIEKAQKASEQEWICPGYTYPAQCCPRGHSRAVQPFRTSSPS